jgi:arabinan endo-1,5-alpha-L-arabinosidase
MKTALILLAVPLLMTLPGFSTASMAADPVLLPVTRNINPASCPQIIKQNGIYYLFSHSGDTTSTITLEGKRANIWMRTSTDLKNWSGDWNVFGTNTKATDRKVLGRLPQPAWWTKAGYSFCYIWAPSINYYNGEYHLYYALAPDWKNPVTKKTPSAIGLATAPTLDPMSPKYQWTDQGLILDGEGTIDPNVVWEDERKPYLLFGSQIPIYERPLDFSTGKLAAVQPNPAPAMAYRKGVIEAPVILKHGNWYYLFYAFGAYMDTNYGEWVGRSVSFNGPYLDRDGVDLNKSGGTRFISSQLLGGINYLAPAHGSVFTDTDGTVYWVGQYYKDSAHTGGRHLWISTIEFDQDGWPRCALTPPYPQTKKDAGGSKMQAPSTTQSQPFQPMEIEGQNK